MKKWFALWYFSTRPVGQDVDV